MKQQLQEGLMSAEEEAAANLERERAKHDLLQVLTSTTHTHTNARAHARANGHAHNRGYRSRKLLTIATCTPPPNTQAHELLKRTRDDEDNASATASSMYGGSAGAGGAVADPDAGGVAGVVALHDTRSSQELYDTIALGIDPDLDPMAQVKHTKTSARSRACTYNHVWLSYSGNTRTRARARAQTHT